MEQEWSRDEASAPEIQGCISPVRLGASARKVLVSTYVVAY